MKIKYFHSLFGRALRPEEWIASHGIDREDVDLLVTVDMLLTRQLQARWQGWSELKPHQQALLAVLLLIGKGESKQAETLTDDLMLALTTTGGGTDVAGMFSSRVDIRSRVEGLLTQHATRVAEIASGHFWVETVLAEAWITCREGQGVWPSARYQWVKIVDRPLWYTISSLGSHAVYVECAGILAHHLAERQLQMPLAVPRVRRASEAIVYDYLDLSPERIKTRSKRQDVRLRLVPGQIRPGNETTSEDTR